MKHKKKYSKHNAWKREREKDTSVFIAALIVHEKLGNVGSREDGKKMEDLIALLKAPKRKFFFTK